MQSIASPTNATPHRRRAIAAIAAAAAIAVTLAACVFRTHVAASLASFSRLHFSYHEVDEWPGECKLGKEQMPVDVPAKTAVFQPSQALHWTFLPKDLSANQEQQSLMFNGHTIQAQGFDYITFLNYKGKNYELLQFHFHTPSENRVDGKAYASEMHMVHKASDGSLLVFGIFLEIDSDDDSSAPSSPLKPVFEAIPVLAHDIELASKQEKDGSGKADASMLLLGFNIRSLLKYLEDNSFSSRYYYLQGSLTTPPCTEHVQWLLAQRHLTIPGPVLSVMEELEGENSRIVQSIGQRVVYKSF